MNDADRLSAWAKRRRVCSRGLAYQVGKDLPTWWAGCRRGDWLCWMLDWVHHGEYGQVYSHADYEHWKIFLYLLNGMDPKKATPEFSYHLLKKFNDWDMTLKLSHDETPYNEQWAQATEAVRAMGPPVIPDL